MAKSCYNTTKPFRLKYDMRPKSTPLYQIKHSNLFRKSIVKLKTVFTKVMKYIGT